MRIMSFQKINWHNYLNNTSSKLVAAEFTTWRFTRKDKDWQPGERIQIVIRARFPDRLPLGEAIIMKIESRETYSITREEANVDGFRSDGDLIHYLNLERHSKKLPYPSN